MRWCVAAVQRQMERDDIALEQQFVEGDELRRRVVAAVVGCQHPASESVQAPDDGCADVPDPDDADGQVAQLPASDTAQPEVACRSQR